MKRISKLFSVLVFGLSLAFYSLPLHVSAADADPPVSKVIIAQIVLGGGSGPEEYVTLYNQTDSDINLDGWSLEYAKNAFTGASCDLPAWSSVDGGSSQSLAGMSLPARSVLSVPQQLNNTGSGSLRLIENTGPNVIIDDLVGWGPAPPCFETAPTTIPATGKAVQRYVDCEADVPLDTDINLADFTPVSTPKADSLSELHIDDCSPPDGGTQGGSGGGPQSSCAGVIISELLPNPAGTDGGHEFIELHNPSGASISLAGCKLQTTASSKIFTFTDQQLAAGQYKAFYDGETGLTLANSGGGSVYLIDTDNTEIDQADYASDLDDDVSFSLVDGNWAASFAPTPNTANKLLTQKPCPPGQFRNEDTDRCNDILVEAAGLGPCGAGKERNAETHRCRSVATLASALATCAPDQFRNPATNRCKKTASAGSLTPCAPGQQRNPDTHRCRKVTGSNTGSGINDVKDVLSATTQSDGSGWMFAVISVAGAFCYGVWEWRGEILQQFLSFKARFS